MIYFKQGDLIEDASDGKLFAFGHGCNCFHTMGSGVAKFISREWRDIYQADVQGSVRGDKDKLGTFTKAVLTVTPAHLPMAVRGYNLYTQFNTSDDRVYYSAIYSSIRRMIMDAYEDAIDLDIEGIKIGIPLIGGGLGGGDWKQIYACIVDAYQDAKHRTNDTFEVDLVIYLLENDESAWFTAFPHGSIVNTVDVDGSLKQRIHAAHGSTSLEDVFDAPTVINRELHRYIPVLKKVD